MTHYAEARTLDVAHARRLYLQADPGDAQARLEAAYRYLLAVVVEDYRMAYMHATRCGGSCTDALRYVLARNAAAAPGPDGLPTIRPADREWLAALDRYGQRTAFAPAITEQECNYL
ncbi:hypothetical protein [Actinomyces ruminicola]|uniref:Uncharacterized protein n=2 Tax=Actinomyces ruminicola TaxID=332524 RepID=A0A1G9SWC2_9ACTO|nr:hypothetical protein [Actinomyces ruminicola]SDM39746.1 hypothetical protein SAMN04487766_102121 [Actinomyces ruminicola]